MTTSTATTTPVTGERADLLESLGKARHFLRHTVGELTDEQAATRSTISELTLGGLIKHVAGTERGWADFVVSGPQAMGSSDIDWSDPDPEAVRRYREGFAMMPGETLAGLLEDYAKVAENTDRLVRELPDLDVSWPLPDAPWFPKGARWSARRVFLHITAETAQHAGHADILREAIDGQKSMG
jgi:hypothetical protein